MRYYLGSVFVVIAMHGVGTSIPLETDTFSNCAKSKYTGILNCTSRGISVLPTLTDWCPYIFYNNEHNVQSIPKYIMSPCGDDITEFYMRHGPLESLHPLAFYGWKALHILDLRDNQLKILHQETCDYFASIKQVYLQYNGIEKLITRSNNSKSVYDLRVRNATLYLNNNSLTNLNDGLPRGFQAILLEGNKIVEVQQSFDLSVLEMEYISLAFNKLKHLSKRMFLAKSKENVVMHQRFIALQTLDLSYNSVEFIEAMSFDGLPNLITLILDGHNMTRITNNSFKSLKTLMKLHFGYGPLSTFDEDCWRDLTKLKELHLNHNEISRLSDNQFDQLPFLLKLDLSFNLLASIPRHTFRGLDALKFLSLAGNKFSIIKDFTFRGMYSLLALDLAYNLIEEIAELAFYEMSRLSVLSLDHNKLNIVQPLAFRNIPYLKTLNFSNNIIQSLTPNTEEETNALQADMYLRGGPAYHKEPEEKMNLPELTELDLSHNDIHDLPPKVFKHLKNLQVLNLQYNRMEHLRVEMIDDLSHLYKLNVHNNRLNCNRELLAFYDYVNGSIDNRTMTARIDVQSENGELPKCFKPLKWQGEPWTIIKTCHGSCMSSIPRPHGEQLRMFLSGPISTVILLIVGYLLSTAWKYFCKHRD